MEGALPVVSPATGRLCCKHSLPSKVFDSGHSASRHVARQNAKPNYGGNDITWPCRSAPKRLDGLARYKEIARQALLPCLLVAVVMPGHWLLESDFTHSLDTDSLFRRCYASNQQQPLKRIDQGICLVSTVLLLNI
jgi:hypothetical protein